MRLTFWLSCAGLFSLIYDLGFNQSDTVQRVIYLIYLITLTGGIIFVIAAYFTGAKRHLKRIWFVDAFFFLLYIFIVVKIILWSNTGIKPGNPGLSLAIVSVFIRELSSFRTEISKKYLNPAQLFILSFALIIITGTFLLLLPNSTYGGIFLIDALFTSTSAVCVTGLTTVDTAKIFTPLGLTIIMLLIQVGGIGIMTFTSYFGFFFKGGASYQNRLMIQDMTNSERISDVFSTLKRIIVITLLIELIGAAIIFFSLDPLTMPGMGHRIFFSIFHAVSAFCNAGFSTLSNNLYEPVVRNNYILHLTVAFLVIMGGIGFPIIFNALRYLRHFLLNRLFNKQSIHKPWVLNMNTRIVLVTTSILLIAGTALIYLLEADNTMADRSWAGKLVTAFFGATTPRTAGFNTVDMTALNISTIMILFVLMWIGASPGSTGGGIKTSTFAIAVLNFMSIARGKDRIEIFRREISPISARRAFASLALSFFVIGTSVFLLALTDKDKDLMKLAFESVSAFGTVGLSLGITGSLSTTGKMIIVFTMFIGRVSMLTILVAFMRRIVNLKYKFPIEDVLIN